MQRSLAVSILLCAAGFGAEPTAAIKVDQVGYPSNARKLAMVVSAAASDTFTVRSAGSGDVVFEGRLSAPAVDADSGDAVRVADFTGLAETGSYYIEVAGAGRSWNFSIAPDVYERTYYLAMRGFYGQRCGTEVDLAPDFPAYRYEACHREGAYHASSGKSGAAPSVKGWHDAGDYGRYIVNSGITTGTLLWTYEMFGGRVGGVRLNIPESDNDVPDILDEIRWNLEWMLTMQDPEDGGVWHKQTTAQFPGFLMPQADRGVNYVIGSGAEPFKSSGAAGNFAAVMAAAGRVYRPFDKAFAERCLDAARKAYAWLERHPDVGFRNPEGVGTGAYGDRNLADERLWAAAELYRTTGEESYHAYFLANYGALTGSIAAAGPQSWSNVATLGLWSYVLGGGKDAGAVEAIRRASLEAADAIVERSAANGYRISLTPRDYVWGSNGVVGNYGLQLLVAHAFRPNPAYVGAALDNLHYLLGRNTFSLSWVTQVGENPFRHPHHRPSGADANAEPWPGLVSGGPNRTPGDPVMREKLAGGLAPAKMYIDDQGAYAANEIAINWQAPLVFLLAGVQGAR